MAANESEIISHLLEVEQNAAALTESAQIDADKKIGEAKKEADARFKAAYEKIVSEQEENYAKASAQAQGRADDAIRTFKETVSASRKTPEEFNSYLDKVLFA